MARKLTPALEREILAKATSGDSSRTIAAWLLAERGVTYSRQGVEKLLKQTRVDRAEVAKLVVREQLGPCVVSDLDILKREQERVEKLTARLHSRAHSALDAVEKADTSELCSPKESKLLASGACMLADLALKSSDRVRALADRKLHFSGADDGDGINELAAAAERVTGRLDSLAAKLAAARRAEKDRADSE